MTEYPSQASLDLLWAVNSPSFVTGSNVAPASTLALDDIDAQELEAFVALHASHRVGRYFETLLLFWLVQIRGVELVGHAVQVRDGLRTIGEVDFMFRDENGVLIHWEVAIKFFLYSRGFAPSEFPGPNASDNFERKAAKLFDQQLELSVVHFPDVQRREAFVKGMTFYPLDGAVPAELPVRMAADHERAGWLHSDQLDQLSERDGEPGFGAVLSKPHWLAPPDSTRLVPISTLREQLEAHFADKAHPVMVTLTADQTSRTESTRLCIVPPTWPNPTDQMTQMVSDPV